MNCEQKIKEALASQKAEIVEKIKEYRDYWNSCGDELNKGKKIACYQLIKSLTEKE